MFEERIEGLNDATERELQLSASVYGKRTYTVEEVMNICGISKPTAYKLIHSGKFPFLKIGQQIRIPCKAFDSWLEGTA